ncbi:MAG TPA: WXG100 family type VII secretion target [Trebonia sp.]
MANTVVGGNDFKVTPAEVQAAATAADNTANTVAEQLAGIKSYVMSFEGVWQGMAANTFQALMHDYDVFGTMLYDALTGIGQGLHGNYANYTESESQNIRNLQTVNGSIPGGNFS